jgi:hypothetical protein
MSISRHVIVSCIDARLAITLDMEHGGSKDMTCVIGSDLDLTITELDSLMELDGLDLIDTIFDHFAREAVYFALLRH